MPNLLPAHLSWPNPLIPHWRRNDLVLSQTCGYPLITALPQLQVVGAFHYAAPGCEGSNYRSWLVVPAMTAGETLEDFRGCRFVFNSEDSHSGYHAPLTLTNGRAFFASLQASGSHRSSLAWLRDGRADIAAIDCVSWALLTRYFTDETRGLKIIAQTASTPGLPLVTSANTSAATLASLQAGLQQVMQNPQHKKLLAALLIDGFSVLTREDWTAAFNEQQYHAEADAKSV